MKEVESLESEIALEHKEGARVMRYRYRNDEELKDSGVEWIGRDT